MQEFRTRARIKNSKVYADQNGIVPFAPSPLAPPTYPAAGTGTRLARWRWNTGGPNNILGSALPTLRGRSRQMVRTTGEADVAIEAIVTDWIGTGIKPQWNTADRGFNRAIADLWLAWTDDADADDRFDFYGLQGLALRSMLEAGDVFARIRIRRPEDDLIVPMQIQLLESEFCPYEKTEPAPGGQGYIQNGIEIDVLGKRRAYWMFREHPADGTRTQLAMTPVRIDGSQVVQLATIRRPGALRGEPWLSRALVKMLDVSQYDDAQVVRQKISAMYTGYASPVAEQVMSGQTKPDADGVSVAPLEPGALHVLPSGVDIKWSAPPSPGDTYQEFMSQQYHEMAAASGVLYEVMTGDYSTVNDRTWRAAMSVLKRRSQRYQHGLFVYQFCRPIVTAWVDTAINAGELDVPKAIDVRKLYRPKWIPQAWEYINPVQDIAAKRDEVRSGFKSRRMQVSADGYDVEEIDEENQTDNKRADDAELGYDSDGRRALPTGAAIANLNEPDPAPTPPRSKR